MPTLWIKKHMGTHYRGVENYRRSGVTDAIRPTSPDVHRKDL